MSPVGPGIYDDLCTHVRTTAGARAAIVIVIGGARGDGFSVQADLVTTLTLPELLEKTARDIRASLDGGAS